MNQTRFFTVLVIVLLAVLITVSSFYVVKEKDKAVVVRFGEVLRVDDTPGLQFKLPFLDDVHSFDSRILSMSEDALPLRTVDEKDLLADVFIKWRIVDARQYYLSVSGQDAATRKLLHQMVVRRLSDEVAKRTLKSVIGGEWRQVTDQLATVVDKDARKFGIEIQDVRLQRLGVPANQTVYETMRTSRTRIADERRAQGTEAAERIRAEGERGRDALLAEAYARAERIRGEGDARAASIYANAAAVAPEFYSFYRSLKAYKESFKKKDDVLVVDPSADFFKYMKKPTR